MIIVKSGRAQGLLKNPKSFVTGPFPGMRKFPGEGVDLWVGVEWEIDKVKNLTFTGSLVEYEQVLLESMASLLIGKPVSRINDLSIRECEAFLRDKNSELALEGMTETEENQLKRLFKWIGTLAPEKPSEEYHFPSEKGPFRNLKLTEKIRELKAFLNSSEILTLYQNTPRPELVDVEDLTVYILAPYGTQKDKSLFEELHILGVEAFQEENLNFIPES